jgi:hypothetical protein
MSACADLPALEIGAVRHVLTAVGAWDCAEPAACYRPFLVAPDSPLPPDGIRHTIRLRQRQAPRLDALKPVFDSESWTLFTEGPDRVFATHGLEGPRDAFRIGRMEPGFVRSSLWLAPGRHRPAFRRVFPLSYPVDQLLQMYALTRCGGLLLHAAGCAANGRALAFAGPSGAGKTTLSRLLAQRLGHASVLSDDRLVLRRGGGLWTAYGTPWPGEGRFARNEAAPLQALLFLCQADVNRIEPMQPREALAELVRVVSIPWFERELVPGLLDACGDMLGTVPAFRLRFRPEAQAVETAIACLNP